ncbi:hypothetical protein N566_16885 [Streptomycetaceae bacterium MP113-05]|nr:hypothetical protein N566_16885 [Streptomycetaceae bacterium MP113-05]
MEQGAATTKNRILREAERLFVERGYHATALQEVADRVGITKPALYYHFPSKAVILGALLEPMTTELQEVLDDAVAEGRRGGVEELRRVLLTGWVDIFLQNRNTLLTLVRELSSAPSDSFDRLFAVMERAIDVGAGPHAGTAERVAVAQAVSAITDPVALMPHLSDDVLRTHLLAGVWRLLGQPGAASGARPGRPRVVSPGGAELARELHASGAHSAQSIADRLGVSRATVYRYLKTPPP